MKACLYVRLDILLQGCTILACCSDCSGLARCPWQLCIFRSILVQLCKTRGLQTQISRSMQNKHQVSDTIMPPGSVHHALTHFSLMQYTWHHNMNYKAGWYEAVHKQDNHVVKVWTGLLQALSPYRHTIGRQFGVWNVHLRRSWCLWTADYHTFSNGRCGIVE